MKRTYLAGLSLAGLVGLGAGCQLLLPTDDSGKTTGTNAGGAGTTGQTDTSTSRSSTDGSTSNSSGKGTSSSSKETTTSSTVTTSTSTGTSSSSSSLMSSTGATTTNCVGGAACNGTNTPEFRVCGNASPVVCDATTPECINYCTSLKSQCGNAPQFVDDQMCCDFCHFLPQLKAVDTSDNDCCRARALNDTLAIDDASRCTFAGVLGVKDGTGIANGCGSQVAHACRLMQLVCGTDDTCYNACTSTLQGQTSMQNFVYGVPTTTSLQTLVADTLHSLGGDMAGCDNEKAKFSCN